MVHAESRDLHAGKLKFLAVSFDRYAVDRKRKLRRHDPHGRYDSFNALRPDDRDGFRTVRISHGQKKSRQAGNMIRMEMGQQDGIDRLEAPAFFPERDLRSFSAVDQKLLPL